MAREPQYKYGEPRNGDDEFGYVPIPASILLDPNLEPEAKLVYAVLMASGAKGITRQNYKEVVVGLGISSDYFISGLHALKEAGLATESHDTAALTIGHLGVVVTPE